MLSPIINQINCILSYLEVVGFAEPVHYSQSPITYCSFFKANIITNFIKLPLSKLPIDKKSSHLFHKITISAGIIPISALLGHFFTSAILHGCGRHCQLYPEFQQN